MTKPCWTRRASYAACAEVQGPQYVVQGPPGTTGELAPTDRLPSDAHQKMRDEQPAEHLAPQGQPGLLHLDGLAEWDDGESFTGRREPECAEAFTRPQPRVGVIRGSGEHDHPVGPLDLDLRLVHPAGAEPAVGITIGRVRGHQRGRDPVHRGAIDPAALLAGRR